MVTFGSVLIETDDGDKLRQEMPAGFDGRVGCCCAIDLAAWPRRGGHASIAL